MWKVAIRNRHGDLIEKVNRRSILDDESLYLEAARYAVENQLGAISINWYIKGERLRMYTGLLQPTGPRKRNEYNPTGDYLEFTLED